MISGSSLQVHCQDRQILRLKILAEIIRIYHECEGRIEKSVPRIAVWHHKACRVMTKGDHEGRIFYPTLTRIMVSFSCSPLFLFKNKLPEVPEYAKIQFHMMTSL